ncbi:MAG: hypothetical protein WDO14_15700 [Bacteroidota bacterium]
MRNKKNNIDRSIGVASLIISVISVGVSLVWIGGFQYSEIKHDIRDMKEDIKAINVRMDKMDARLERIEEDVHKLDVRVNVLEQRKP